MSQVRVLRIVPDGTNKETIELLPGIFNSDQEATAAIKEKGVYAFLEVHSITGKKKQPNANDNKPEE